MRERNPEKTKARILEAAKSVFSQSGFKGTHLAEIEEKSGISKGLILHHYGSKKRLYQTVKSLSLQNFGVGLKTETSGAAPGGSLVAHTIHQTLSELEQDPDFFRMQLWDFLEGTNEMTEPLVAFTEGFINAVDRAQDAGLMRRDIPSFIAPLIVRGALEYWRRNEKLIAQMAENRQLTMIQARQLFLSALETILKNPESPPTV